MSTPNRMQEHWPAVKNFIRQEWPKLPESAYDRINGNYDLFLKYLRETYNNFPAEEARARSKIQSFLNTLE